MVTGHFAVAAARFNRTKRPKRGHPQEDAIPTAFRVTAALDAAEMRGGLRRARIPSLLLAIIGIIGCCGSIHAFMRDQPVYSAYRNAQPCSAEAAADGTAPHSWCLVSDGVVQTTFTDANNNDVTAIVFGPQQTGPPPPSLSSQQADFRDPQPQLDNTEDGSGATYVAENGSTYIATVTLGGQTLQTENSPVPQRVYDFASIGAAFAWTLLWLLVIYSRFRKSRRPRVLRGVKLTLLAGCIAAIATCIRAQPGYTGVSLVWTGVLALILAAVFNVLDALWFRYGVLRLKQIPQVPTWSARL